MKEIARMTARQLLRKSAPAPRMRKRGHMFEPVVGFQSAKAAQVAAYFIAQSGGQIDKLKLAKLAYLAEREHLARYDLPLTYDELYSLPHGPVCSNALNGVDGNLHQFPEWKSLNRHGRDKIYGKRRLTREQLDELSDAEYEVLETIWQEFGKLTAGQVRNYTHEKGNIPEYTEVARGRYPIRYEDVLAALGKSPETIEAVVREIDAYRHLEMAFDR